MSQSDHNILLSQEEIKKIISNLAYQIEQDYRGQSLVVVGVLKGAFIFMADLIRQIKLPLRCDFLRISSYQKDGRPGTLRLDFDLTQPVTGEHVLVLEDVVDTGQTLAFITQHFKTKGAKSLKFGTLLLKQTAPESNTVDYFGKKISKDYVVGFGMDFDGKYRNLPWIETRKLTNF